MPVGRPAREPAALGHGGIWYEASVRLSFQVGHLVGLGVGLLLRAAELFLGLALALLLLALAAQAGVIRQVACSLLHASSDLVHDAHSQFLLWWGTSVDLCPSPPQGKQTARTQSSSRRGGGGSSSSSRGGSCAAIQVCTILISSTASGGIGLRRTGRVASASRVRSAISSGGGSGPQSATSPATIQNASHCGLDGCLASTSRERA